jgi:hypothetical protein
VSFQPPGGPPPPPPPGGPPPPPGNPFPPQGYPGPQQPWSQQQSWAAGSPPKRRGNGWKWGLGALVLLVVIGVTAAVTISVTKDGSDDTPSPTGETFGLASADDKGPVDVITEDPSCAAWGPINQTFVDIQRRGWDQRDPSIPASEWAPEQRSHYEEVAAAARAAADQSVALAKLTPHRVMRELFEQFIAYARAYSDAIPGYTASDNSLAAVAITTSTVLVTTCSAIAYGSAPARGPLVASGPPPSDVAALTDPDQARPFMLASDSTCPEWGDVIARFGEETRAWQRLNPNDPASTWTPAQRAAATDVIPAMIRSADRIHELGQRSSNPSLRDFADFAAQYRRAYAGSLPTYAPSDYYLADTALRTTSLISEACKAVEE